MRKAPIHIFTLLLSVLLSGILQAQSSGDYMLADRLMQQQEYESALKILQELYDESPQEYIYFEQLMECHIQLKQYDEALNTAQNLPAVANYQPQVNILIGKLYHFKEDTSRAYRIWERNLSDYPGQFQVYLNTARAMSDRGLHMKAVGVYEQGREAFNNPNLFLNDIANELMQAGRYERAIRQWIQYIELQPEQINYVQRLLLRFNDPLVYDITIIELEDKLSTLAVSSPNYTVLYQLQIWLLQENKLYKRALSTARAYENSTSDFNYALFSLGRKLVENKEFELAEEAFSYYISRSNGEVKWRNMEELATVYSKWAKHLDDNNLDFTQQSDSLFQRASSTLSTLIKEGENYTRIGTALILRADLELDHTYDLEAAMLARDQLSTIQAYAESPELAYLEGRIHLAKREFTQARIAFTKSNKRADIGELAEKSRYFLALTDFFTGDYEFSKIQLKSLGRQSTSYYANDALQLRVWLQEGVAADTTGRILEPFADAYFQSYIGNKEEARTQYYAMLDDPALSVLHDDIFIEIARSGQVNPADFSGLLDSFLNKPAAVITLREKLMWQRAKFAEEALKKSSDPATGVSAQQVIQYYEQLILDYPQGFYADSARLRLKELTEVNS